MTGRNQTGSWWCKQAKSVNQAKVFKAAHAAPQGQCGNLTNALKLLANQQEDGDGLTQNIVTKGSHGGFEKLHTSRQSSRPGSWTPEGRPDVFQGTKAERRGRTPRSVCQGKPRRIDAQSRSWHVEVVHQCRPHGKKDVESSFGGC